MQTLLSFLKCPTPKSWLNQALAEPHLLLLDHAHCEKKAASTAISLMFRYPQHPNLLHALSRLAREELRHFEMVLKIMQNRALAYDHLKPCRYAGELHKHAKAHEPDRLVDILIIGAFIEARSCERFFALAPLLDQELNEFYSSLLKSEQRHFELYLNLAKDIFKKEYQHKKLSDEVINQKLTERINYFAQLEANLINEPDSEFRFHSGTPK